MLAAALALRERDHALAAQITHRAIVNLPISMRAFAPKGCYPEGPAYWAYGTDFNVLAIALLESVLGSDFGLNALPGFTATADYLDLVTGPSGMTFNYADGDTQRNTDCAIWWFAKRFNRPDILAYFEKDAFLRYCSTRPTFSGQSANRLFAFTLGGENGVVLTSKLIDGTFPDYSRVIPTGNDKLLKLDPKSFWQGVDRVATIATEKTRAVKMALDTDKVTLSVTSPDNGTAAEEVPASYSSAGFEIGFNATYLKDILGQIDGDTVELHLADAGAPTLIRKDDKSPALYVLMPMRV